MTETYGTETNDTRHSVPENSSEFSSPLQSAQVEEPKKIIKVGFFPYSGYHVKNDETGELSGYGYEFLQKIGNYLDEKFEYVADDVPFSDSIELLRNGEIDILTSASKTPEREHDFLFTERPIGTTTTIFTVKAGNDKVTPNDYSTYDGLIVAMIEGNSKNKIFEDFAAEKGFSFTPVYFENESDLVEALQNERVEAAVSGSLRSTTNEWVIESLSPQNFYLITSKDNQALMDRINDAIRQLDTDDPGWRTELSDKYYGTDQNNEVLLTSEERDYIARLKQDDKVLKVLANPARPPFSYMKNNEIHGITPEIFELIADRVDLPYEFISASDSEQYQQKRSDKDCDIALDLLDNYYQAETLGYRISKSYFQTTLTRIMRKDFTKDITKIAVNENSTAIKDYVNQIYSTDQIIYYDTKEECVQAVENNEADATILFTYSAEDIMRQDYNDIFSFTLINNVFIPYCLGVNNDIEDDTILLSILNKSIAALKTVDVSNVIIDETDPQLAAQRIDFVSFLMANPIFLISGLVFLFLFLFVISMLILRSHNQKKLQEKVDDVSNKYEEQSKLLETALERSEQANKTKTIFLNNMSHDIRTPMNAIIGFSHLASEHIDSKEKVRDYLQKISKSSNHLLSLINDVLDMSRIESGTVNIEENPEDISEILHDLRDIIEGGIHAKQLDLFIETVDVKDAFVYCDKLHLNQILLNLLSNAMKFTNPGGLISLMVTQYPNERPGYADYEFKIKDTGIGMSPEFQKTIFQPFTRERTSTVSGIQGTGLGMAITKNIVDMMGGTISVDSTIDIGTTFTVRLTFKLQGEPHEIQIIEQVKDMRALVIDDDLVSCQSVAKMLRHFGMRSDWTLYGQEAVVRTEEALEIDDPYNLYIVDWAMPALNGIETAKKIRKAVGDNTPIILLSAYDWIDIEEEALEAGINDFIAKPLFAKDLQHILNKIFNPDYTHEQEAEKVEIENYAKEFAGKRLLLVEDNQFNMDIAKELLTEADFLVDTAEDGTIAVDKVKYHEPLYYDVILMDIQMPIMNGYEATKQIRSMDDMRANIPIIALTADAFMEDRQKAIDCGMNGHMSKPIEIDNLFKTLHEVLINSENNIIADSNDREKDIKD